MLVLDFLDVRIDLVNREVQLSSDDVSVNDCIIDGCILLFKDLIAFI
jgi:hypothetical protein